MADYAWDWTIAGKGFLDAADREHPAQRSFARVSRQQLDTANTPGEQSMDLWWLRSQSTFTGGAGKAIFEPAGDEFVRTQFAESEGVDPWTDGQVKLLRRMEKQATLSSPAGWAPAGVPSVTHHNESGYAFIVSVGSTGGQVTLTDMTSGSPVSAGTWSGEATDIHAMCSFNGWIIVVHEDAIYRFDPDNPIGAGPVYSMTKIYDLATFFLGGTEVLGLYPVNGRLMLVRNDSPTYPAGTGVSWWEIGSGVTAVTLDHTLTSGAGSRTFRVENFYITDACSSPGGILIAGMTPGGSAPHGVFRIVLEAAGTLPTTSAPQRVAEFPQGERIRAIASHSGKWLVVATTLGVRVGLIGGDASVDLGPVTVPVGGLGSARIVCEDRFAYVAYTVGVNKGRVVRIDLTQSDSSGRFAWANDVYHSDWLSNGGLYSMGVCTNVGGFRSLWLFHMGASVLGLYVQSPSRYVDSGSLIGGQILYGTLEPKVFRAVRTSAEVPTNCLVTVASRTASGVEAAIATYGTSVSGEAAVVTPYGRRDRLGFKYVLTSNTGQTSTPVLTGYSVKALPAVDNVELLSIRLLCYDVESDRFNVRSGGPGRAAARFAELRDVLQSGGIFTVVNNNTGESLNCVLSPDSVAYSAAPFEYTRSAPPQRCGGEGGVISLTVRIV